MPEASFLDKLHARFATDPAIVTDLIHRATGRRVTRLHRVVRGYDNEVHRADLDPSGVVYARIRRERGGYGGELWAMDQARAHEVPVPELLALETITDERGEREAMVLAAAPGDQLRTALPSLSGDRRRAVMIDLGRQVARLHEIRTPGPWRPGEDGAWPDPTELRRSYVRDRRAEHDQLRAAGLTAEEVDRILAVLEISPDPPGADFVLCHGDLSPEHVFATGTRVSCLIDWGMWHGGSVLGELAYLDSTFEPADFVPLVEGYGRRLDAELRRDIALVTVSQLIGHVAHHVGIGDQVGTERNVAIMRRALARLAGSDGRASGR